MAARAKKGESKVNEQEPTSGRGVSGRLDEREFLREVLAGLDDAPRGLADRLPEVLDQAEARSAAICDLLEELTQ